MIYFIQQGKTGPIKIGYTANSDISKRINSMQPASPEPLILLGYIEGEKDKEALLHRFFHAYRLKGEWFEPDPMVLNYILSLILGIDFDTLQAQYNESCKESMSLDAGPVLAGRMKLDDFLNEFEIRIIKYVLEKVGNNKPKAAKVLGVSFRSIRHRISKYKLY